MACSSYSTGIADKSLIGEHLNCSICLEVYTRPKALTCMHTFCEQCIDSVIKKSAAHWATKRTIVCPVCRKESPSSSQDPSQWAKGLPLNYAIVSLLENVDRKGGNKVCGPCQSVGKTQPFESFCVDCKEYQCQECAIRHVKYFCSRTHRLVKAGELTERDLLPLNLGKLERCDNHADKAVEFYCEEHEVMCCPTCAIVVHRTCKKLTEVTKMGKELIRQGEKLQQLQSQMVRVKTDLGKSTQVLQNNVLEMGKEAADIQQRLTNVVNSVVQRAVSLRARVAQDCKKLQDHNTKNLQDRIGVKKSNLAAVEKLLRLLQSALRYGSDAQIFVAYQKIKQNVNPLLQVQDSTSTLHLLLSVDPLLNSFIQKKEQLAKVSVNVRSVKAGKGPRPAAK